MTPDEVPAGAERTGDDAAAATAHLPPPFERFVVDTERMPDGRLIHYYQWPDRDDEPSGEQPGV